MKTALVFAFSTLCFAGTHPRPSAQEYRAQETLPNVTVAAERIPPDQVRNLFSTDLSKYIVVEVALYPRDGKSVNVNAGDFVLRAGSGETVRAANPAAVAHARQQASIPKSSPSDITVYPTAGIGYESGPYGRGVTKEAGVAVGVGQPPYPQPPGPASTDRDRATMQQELEDKGLPPGATATPIAGYLFFPAPTKQKRVTFDLEYFTHDGTARLPLK